MNASIAAKLQQDPSIDWIVPWVRRWRSWRSSPSDGSRKPKCHVRPHLDAANAIKDGKIALAVDAQPYLQGYLAVESCGSSRQTATSSAVAVNADRPGDGGRLQHRRHPASSRRTTLDSRP